MFAQCSQASVCGFFSSGAYHVLQPCLDFGLKERAYPLEMYATGSLILLSRWAVVLPFVVLFPTTQHGVVPTQFTMLRADCHGIDPPGSSWLCNRAPSFLR